ncbi:MAG: 50S ribosomal protein L15 [Acidimicrobiaceae bacterium]|nr:50S ribosomal protein L15 [Acidimicrobiaceae bacterium]
MLKPHDLQPAPGSKKRPKRVGRGIAGKGGKTAGRGTKGTKARSKVPVWYEGGQLPLQRRLPKMKGFTNPFRVEYQPINLDTITESELSDVTPEALLEKGLVSKGAMVKILGRGEISRPVTVKAHAVSKSAEAAITAAGGTVEILPPTFKGPRPPARGNQHTNR